jgi:hypothetical protein
MKKEYYHNALKMLRLQLQEEQKSFELALNGNKKFTEIKEIKQRITSLKNSLFNLDKWLQSFYR